MKHLALVLALCAPFGLVSSAKANMVLYMGTFDTALAQTPGAPSQISGTFSFSFDDSIVTTGVQSFDVPLESISMTQLGSTTFDTSNAGVRLTYINGNFFRSYVGGLISGVTILYARTDDFILTFAGPKLDGARLADALVSTRSSLGTLAVEPTSGGIVVNAVPEPTSSAMACIAAAVSLGWLRVRKSA